MNIEMTRKNARKIILWNAIERYRTAGGTNGVVSVPERLSREQAKYRYSDAMLEARK